MSGIHRAVDTAHEGPGRREVYRLLSTTQLYDSETGCWKESGAILPGNYRSVAISCNGNLYAWCYVADILVEFDITTEVWTQVQAQKLRFFQLVSSMELQTIQIFGPWAPLKEFGWAFSVYTSVTLACYVVSWISSIVGLFNVSIISRTDLILRLSIVTPPHLLIHPSASSCMARTNNAQSPHTIISCKWIRWKHCSSSKQVCVIDSSLEPSPLPCMSWLSAELLNSLATGPNILSS